MDIIDRHISRDYHAVRGGAVSVVGSGRAVAALSGGSGGCVWPGYTRAVDRAARVLVFCSAQHPASFWLADRTIAAPVAVAVLLAAVADTDLLIGLSYAQSGHSGCCRVGRSPRSEKDVEYWSSAATVALFVAWLVAFAIASGELSATILVNPAGITTVPILVFRMLHTGVHNQVAAVCLTNMLGVLVVAALVICLAPRLWRWRRAASVGERSLAGPPIQAPSPPGRSPHKAPRRPLLCRVRLRGEGAELLTGLGYFRRLYCHSILNSVLVWRQEHARQQAGQIPVNKGRAPETKLEKERAEARSTVTD